MNSWGIHWFRRDLRLVGNPALEESLRRHDGRVLGLFCFDRDFLSRPDFSTNRFGFFLKTLRALREEMHSAGGDLLVLDTPPRQAFPLILDSLRPGRRPTSVSWNRDYEPFSRARDAWAEEFWRGQCEILTARDHLLVEPWEIAKPGGAQNGYYSVYTPFFKRWSEILQRPAVRAFLDEQAQLLRASGNDFFQKGRFHLRWTDVMASLPEDALERTCDMVLRQVVVPLPEAGTRAGLAALERFAPRLSQYEALRDFPAEEATSQMSIYLKNGSLTAAQVLATLLPALAENAEGKSRFVKELAWREFYYHLLWHCPAVENESFRPAYRDLRWPGNREWLERWKEGMTGFPIVDAGMRQLKQTGWMHNRVRMIVASFLTKDLLLDWRLGEQHFMNLLLDGDLAANNGGWQWAASTGCDPQPYFRIFNPQLQSEKFDPQGTYIARYVPELASLRGKREIHAPRADLRGAYPTPLVNHSLQRMKALELFRSRGAGATRSGECCREED